MTPQAEQFCQQIRDVLPSYDTVEDAAAAVRRNVMNLLGELDETVEANLEAATEAVRRSRKEVRILRRASIVRSRKEWYHGPVEGDRHWPALERYLSNTKSWGSDAVSSIDESSSEVVSLLDDPRQDQFRCRGLVVGYVQSGKTANMTAVIAKAVDAGYNLIVVLGGVTNKLRAQTQRRLFADIVERHRERWFLYTTDDDHGDFTYPKNGQFAMPQQGNAQLAVMKKEGARLRAFSKTIRKTSPAILQKLKVLLIDDECDQASVNSSRGEFDMTRINEEIRRILASLPAVSYVGYTATPFANVFIDPFPHNRDELDDLYPSEFITALPRPDGYFGALEVFGSDNADLEDGRDMLRVIPDEDPELLRPASRHEKESFQPVMTKSLRDAFLWFLASCAIRRARGQGDQHMTMLVHSSQYVGQHRQMAELMSGWLASHGPDLLESGSDTAAMFDAVFERERTRTGTAGNDSIPESLDEVRERLPEVLEAIEFAIENGESEWRLDYTSGPRTYVAIGGTVLARGLTLEGLTVSFFLRTSKQYDTLLQMGRWFGYRPGYDDLPRLWTTADLMAKFRALATIEEEVREDIGVYRARKASPTDFAVKIRSMPGMAITSASKMKHALRTSISFEGQHVQTIRFEHRDLNTVKGNWTAAERLGDASMSPTGGGESGTSTLFRGVPVGAVRRFLLDSHISEEHMSLRKDLLLGYIDKMAGQLDHWNVAVVESREGNASDRSLGNLGKVRTVKRARLAANATHYADIKALMSKADVLIDAASRPAGAGKLTWSELKEYRPDVPLLLIYPVDAHSAPAPGSKTREPLGAVGDLIGFGIVFPGEPDRSGDYFSVDLDAPDQGLIEEDELAEVEQDADAPGVS